MTTVGLIVVIIVLVANLAILYLPFDKKRKVIFSLVAVGVLMVFVLQNNVRNGKVPTHIYQVAQHNQVAKKATMATFNLSEEKLCIETKKPTPIEFGVTVVLVLTLVFTPILLYVVKDDNESLKVQKVLLFLNIAACGLLLSLYYGLELTLVPWHKKSDKE